MYKYSDIANKTVITVFLANVAFGNLNLFFELYKNEKYKEIK
jgi:hypothetical protein